MLCFIQKLLTVVLAVNIQQSASQGAQLGHGHRPTVQAANILAVDIYLTL